MKRQHLSYVRINDGKVDSIMHDRYCCDICTLGGIVMRLVNHGWVLCDAHLPLAELYRAERALRGLA